MFSKDGVKWKQVCATKQKSVTWKVQVTMTMVRGLQGQWCKGYSDSYSDFAHFIKSSPLFRHFVKFWFFSFLLSLLGHQISSPRCSSISSHLNSAAPWFAGQLHLLWYLNESVPSSSSLASFLDSYSYTTCQESSSGFLLFQFSD